MSSALRPREKALLALVAMFFLLQIHTLWQHHHQHQHNAPSADDGDSTAATRKGPVVRRSQHQPEEAPSSPCPETQPPLVCPPQTPCPVAPDAESDKAVAPAVSTSKGEGRAPFARVKIVVFTYNRIDGLRRLLASLKGADYMGFRTISLHIFMDFPKEKKHGGIKHLDGTREFLDDFEWPHGDYQLHRREVNVGLKRSILEAWYPTGDDEVGAFFEDDIEVSPLWFRWAYGALGKYAHFPKKKPRADGNTDGDGDGQSSSFDAKLLGVSLFRPIHDELSGKTSIVDSNGDPFLLQQPCSWGAVYLPRPWREFRNWYDAHSDSEPALRDPEDPGVDPSSNTWDSKSSWKKYLIKLMYTRGWYMVYPNFPKKWVLSTNHLMKGEHPTPPKKLFELPLLPAEFVESSQGRAQFHRYPPLPRLEAYDVMFRHVRGGLKNLPNYR